MFDEIIKSMQARDLVKYRKATKDIQTNVILETLDVHKTLPLANKFKPGELVTQLITSIDPKDGEPNRRYSFPLPGQPTRVVADIVGDVGYVSQKVWRDKIKKDRCVMAMTIDGIQIVEEDR
jgi:hypothetical protein